MKKNILLFHFCLLLAIPAANTQSITGMPGYFHIPTANFNPDGTLYLGAGFIPKKYLSYTEKEYDLAIFYTSLTFLPFVELNLRATRPLGALHYTVDRMPSIRIRLLKESEYLPAVVAGAHDFIAITDNSTSRKYGAFYLVMTKTIYFRAIPLHIETTAGYGTNWLHSSCGEFTGLWGGVSIQYSKLPFASFMLEYDGEVFNPALQLVFFKHLHLTAGFINFDSFAGCVSFHINLTRLTQN